MSETPVMGQQAGLDVGDYCRQIEAHLTRVNDGQIIRIVGPAFELARSWAREGIPLSVVCHGIDRKAERHEAGRARRALRLEFCEADVTAVYEQWQRAVGVRRTIETVPPEDGAGQVHPEPRPAAISRHLERAMDRLSRAVGRMDRSDMFREAAGRALQDLADLRDVIKTARGAARLPLLERLPLIDEALMAAARAEVGPDGLVALERQATEELAAFRSRLAPAAWEHSVALSVTRLLRDSLGLPTLTEP